jgi:hypothetical protein
VRLAQLVPQVLLAQLVLQQVQELQREQLVLLQQVQELQREQLVLLQQVLQLFAAP